MAPPAQQDVAGSRWAAAAEPAFPRKAPNQHRQRPVAQQRVKESMQQQQPQQTSTNRMHEAKFQENQHQDQDRQRKPRQVVQSGGTEHNSPSVDEMSVFVKNIKWSSTVDDLRTCFAQFGKVLHVIHQHNWKRQSSGPAYAFVQFQRKKAAANAIRKSAGGALNLHGNILHVEPRKQGSQYPAPRTVAPKEVRAANRDLVDEDDGVESSNVVNRRTVEHCSKIPIKLHLGIAWTHSWAFWVMGVRIEIAGLIRSTSQTCPSTAQL